MPAYTTDTTETTGRRQVVGAVLFLLLSMVVMYLPTAAQQQIASALRDSILRPFLIAQEGLAGARMRAADAERLRSQLDSLVATTTSRSTLAEENRRLRALLSLGERVGPAFLPASVVRAGTAGSESMFLVDRGADDGVLLRSPVITRFGLVGTIRDVGRASSIGIDWTHPDFRASAMTEDGATYGMVQSRRGDFREEDRLILDGTPFHSSLEEGTVVVTSGLGDVLPRGIPIGRVTGLAEADAGWRKSYWLAPFVHPGSVTHVLVAAPGADSVRMADLSSAWPPDSIATLEAMASWEAAREDSLAALGDSVRLLRAILHDERVQDSLRALVAAGVAVEIPRPAPPLATAGGVGGGQTGGAAQRETGSAAQQTGGAAQQQTGGAAQRQTGGAAQQQTGGAAQQQTGGGAQQQTGGGGGAAAADSAAARAGAGRRMPIRITDTLRLGGGADTVRSQADTGSVPGSGGLR